MVEIAVSRHVQRMKHPTFLVAPEVFNAKQGRFLRDAKPMSLNGWGMESVTSGDITTRRLVTMTEVIAVKKIVNTVRA